MTDLLVTLIPLAVGVIVSPLALMALVAVLVSRQPQRNGLAYLAGWAAAVVCVALVCWFLFGAVTVQDRDAPPTWVSVLRLVIAVGLLAAGVYVMVRGRERTREMARAVTPSDVVTAAPQLPGWLHSVDTFRPPRTAALGFGIFVLNPVDLSCLVLAVLDIRLADISPAAELWTTVIFGLIAIAPIVIPVVIVLLMGDRATPLLMTVRGWVATHTSVLNALLLLLIGAMQANKALTTLVGG